MKYLLALLIVSLAIMATLISYKPDPVGSKAEQAYVTAEAVCSFLNPPYPADWVYLDDTHPGYCKANPNHIHGNIGFVTYDEAMNDHANARAGDDMYHFTYFMGR